MQLNFASTLGPQSRNVLLHENTDLFHDSIRNNHRVTSVADIVDFASGLTDGSLRPGLYD